MLQVIETCYEKPAYILTCTGLAEAVIRPKILGNRLGIFNADFDSNGFLFYISGKYLQFRRKKTKACVKEIFCPPHTTN